MAQIIPNIPVSECDQPATADDTEMQRLIYQEIPGRTGPVGFPGVDKKVRDQNSEGNRPISPADKYICQASGQECMHV
jgi:hypothetical protein